MIVTNLISLFEQKSGRSFPNKDKFLNKCSRITENDRKADSNKENKTEIRKTAEEPIPLPRRTIKNVRNKIRRQTCAITSSSVSTDSGNSSPSHVSPGSDSSSISSLDDKSKENEILSDHRVNLQCKTQTYLKVKHKL